MKKMLASLVLMFCVSSAFAKATIELGVVSCRDSYGSIWLTYQFTNTSTVTFEDVRVPSRLMDKNNQLISTINLHNSNLRPSKILSNEAYVQNVTCAEVSHIVVEDFLTCQAGGTNCGPPAKLIFLPGRFRLTTK